MGTINIVTDSSITIAPDLLKELNITVVPLSVMIDSKLYSDNDLKEEGQFLQLMKASKTLPKTSQPPVGLFADVYEKLVQQGTTDIIAIHISPTLSGTIEASRQGAELASAPVTVLDSGFTDQAMAFQVIQAAKMAQAGNSVEEILAAIKAIKEKTELYIGVSTLENLVKGGRIGRVTGVISSLLNVRVVMELKNDALKTLVKGRGNKTFLKWLDSYLAANRDRSIAELTISYAGSNEFANTLKEKIETVFKGEITVLETGSIIQTHTGEGAFAVMVRYE
ncbi:DegV family protein [Streptococcus phocae subsp. phocae]